MKLQVIIQSAHALDDIILHNDSWKDCSEALTTPAYTELPTRLHYITLHYIMLHYITIVFATCTVFTILWYFVTWTVLRPSWALVGAGCSKQMQVARGQCLVNSLALKFLSLH